MKRTPIADLERMLVDATAKATPTEPRTRAAANVVKLPRASKGINLAPKPLGQQKACRADSKQAAIIDCLVYGATLWELTGATSRNASGGKDWSESSVRSALHWDVHSVKGYGVRTEIMTPRQAYDAGHEAHAENHLGTEHEHQPIIPVYFLVLPKGMNEPLAHVEHAQLKMAANRC